MPVIPLPENASLEHLKKQAKLLQQLVAAADSGGFDLLREFHPRFPAVTPQSPPVRFKLSDAQLVIARLYGHQSWAKLRAHVDLVSEYTRPDPADAGRGDHLDRFVSLACVSYNGHHDPLSRIDTARTILRSDLSLSAASIAAAAVTGDHQLLAQRIAGDPSLLDRPCGPHQWPPLLYCCYSRLDEDPSRWSTVTSAQVLLDAGADPNAGFLWRGLLPPFTALTGALGRGEADQPTHPAAAQLARSLLVAGADPNDGQALYNNGLAGTAHDDPTHLELLVEFGLGTPTSGPWYQRFGPRLSPPEELLHDELEVAAHRGLPARMRFVAGTGVDLDRPVGRSRRTPWQLAADAGHTDILDILRQSGVTQPQDQR